MIAFINEHRAAYGADPPRRVPPSAPWTRYAHAAQRTGPRRPPGRATRGAPLLAAMRRVYEATLRVCGVRKVWRRLGREGVAVARCTVGRRIRAMGLAGVVRGKTVRTTGPSPAAA